MSHLRKILLVEDDELDAELTLATLNTIDLAHEIIWLETGEALIEYLTEHGSQDISLCILDLKMPIISGLEALEIIKGNPSKFDYFPIVILTSSQESPEINRCYELGVNAFMTKPVQPDEFSMAIRTLALFWAVFNILPPNR
ncbi:MAG: response regulator [Bacteroidota bacterium]